MPTPVGAARQCLTQEAAEALDDAVAVARRRGHAQTTSMHMVSSLLSLPNSSLREACTRARNNAYPTRVQFKALELSLSVALDRLPSSQASKLEEPPVSNSLMAAIKRSQANQRRQPENFNFYQQQQQQFSSCSSVPIVKVELPNLIVSILDDPLVSRVFGEAGFRNCDIKTATLRPGSSFHALHLFGYSSRYKRQNPPLFLYNFRSSESINDVGEKGFGFPFMGYFSRDENSRRIGEVMVRNKKRNPLLLGVSSGDALRSFLELVQRKIDGVLPVGLRGLSMICVKDDIQRLVNGDLDEGSFKERLEQVLPRTIEDVGGHGVVVNFGDLKPLTVESVCIDDLRYLVSILTELLQIHAGKLWLIGAAATHELYYNFLHRFPSVEEDWDLQILTITSLTFSMGGSYPKSSLMESFVPLGGFFSMPSDVKSSSLSNSCHYVVRCHLYNEKCDEEVKALSNGGVCISVAELSQYSSPLWLHSAEASSKVKNDRLLLNTKIAGIQRKWDGNCQLHHFGQSFPRGCADHLSFPFPRVSGFQVNEDGKEIDSKGSSNHSNISVSQQASKNVISSLSADMQQSAILRGPNSMDVQSKASNLSLLSISIEDPTKSEGQGFDASSVSIDKLRPSPSLVSSVDLGLGIAPVSMNRQHEKPVEQTSVDAVTHRLAICPSHYSQPKDPKMLYKFLAERVAHQEAAICCVVEAVTQRQNNVTAGIHGATRGDLWFDFTGPDRLGKRKLGMALADILFGGIDRFIHVDLSFQDEISHADRLCYPTLTNKYNSTMRGTAVDYLVEKLSRNPSVVFLENFDQADLVVQNSVFHAVKTGRFKDLNGREANTSNSLFIAATSPSDGNVIGKYPEEEILMVKGCVIRILIGFDLNDDLSGNTSTFEAINKGCSDLISVNKRKLTISSSGRRIDQMGILDMAKRANKSGTSYLDLNLPADGSEACNTDGKATESDSCENSRSWLEDFDGLTDRVVVFKRFSFETLAEKLIKDMTECLCSVVGSECALEIELKVMQQLLAAAYLFDNKVEDWIQHVLKQGFVEAIGKYSLDSSSVVKLVSSEKGLTEGQQFGFLLPSRIVLN